MQQDFAAAAELIPELNLILEYQTAAESHLPRYFLSSLIGRLYQISGEHELAISYLTQAAEIIPEPFSQLGKYRRQYLRMQISRVLLRQQNYQLAEQVLQSTMAQVQADGLMTLWPELHLLLG